MVIVLPAAASATTAEAFCFSARIPTSLISASHVVQRVSGVEIGAGRSRYLTHCNDAAWWCQPGTMTRRVPRRSVRVHACSIRLSGMVVTSMVSRPVRTQSKTCWEAAAMPAVMLRAPP